MPEEKVANAIIPNSQKPTNPIRSPSPSPSLYLMPELHWSRYLDRREEE